MQARLTLHIVRLPRVLRMCLCNAPAYIAASRASPCCAVCGAACGLASSRQRTLLVGRARTSWSYWWSGFPRVGLPAVVPATYAQLTHTEVSARRDRKNLSRLEPSPQLPLVRDNRVEGLQHDQPRPWGDIYRYPGVRRRNCARICA